MDFTRGRILAGIVRIWAKSIFLFNGVKTEIIGLNNLDLRKNYIFAANHSSSLDIPLLLGFIPFWVVPIAKKELKWIPFLGWAMQMAGHIFIDRSNHEKAMSSIIKIKSSLMKRPRSILIFPEGSRTLDGEIKPFKSGGLSLGISTKMDIIPIGIIGTYDSLKKGSEKFINNKLILIFGEPIKINQYSNFDRKILAEKVRYDIKKIIESYNN